MIFLENMHVKILMCTCYKNLFQSEGASYFQHIIHFNCKCKVEHAIFVHFCSRHYFGNKRPTIADYSETIRDKCYWDKAHANEICHFCCQVRYFLNFACHTICVEDPKSLKIFWWKIKQFLWMIIKKKQFVSLIFILKKILFLLA